MESSEMRPLEKSNCEAKRHHAAGSKACSRRNVGSFERKLSSLGGGLFLVLGLAQGRTSGLLLSLLGGGLLYRGITGHCHGYEALGIDTSEHQDATVIPAQTGVKVDRTITVNCTPEKLYAFWREVENLPRVMQGLQSVTAIDRERSHWVASGPIGISVKWDAEIFDERENEFIAWRSLPNGDLETAGSIHFRSLGEGRGTAVSISLKYNPPAGKVGDAFARLMQAGFAQQLDRDLRAFKSVMEAGEVPTTSGQPTGAGASS